MEGVVKIGRQKCSNMMSISEETRPRCNIKIPSTNYEEKQKQTHNHAPMGRGLLGPIGGHWRSLVAIGGHCRPLVGGFFRKHIGGLEH